MIGVESECDQRAEALSVELSLGELMLWEWAMSARAWMSAVLAVGLVMTSVWMIPVVGRIAARTARDR
ncbi:hypothetical protein [Streptomyces sp. NPDC002763]|uniref:hypothetical protein n=1 Tax=Streptomyces sp. NPDC002763 TaxID=3154427 RepID=UPI003331344A